MSARKLNLSIGSYTNYFPNSRKVYVQGSRPDIRVPMREITLSPTKGLCGEETNPPLRVYDTSGPYTDPHYTVDLEKGLPKLRRPRSSSAATWRRSLATRGDASSAPRPDAR